MAQTSAPAETNQTAEPPVDGAAAGVAQHGGDRTADVDRREVARVDDRARQQVARAACGAARRGAALSLAADTAGWASTGAPVGSFGTNTMMRMTPVMIDATPMTSRLRNSSCRKKVAMNQLQMTPTQPTDATTDAGVSRSPYGAIAHLAGNSEQHPRPPHAHLQVRVPRPPQAPPF